MRRLGLVSLCWVWLISPAAARHDAASSCGTTRETPNEVAFLHRQSVRARGGRGLRPLDTPAPSANRDIGNIAIVEDSEGVVARQNQFNLDSNTLAFTPAGSGGYRYSVSAQGYDATAAAVGAPLVALDDDDSRLIDLPFAFGFFGATYRQVFVNSDGNLTFNAGDSASTDRSLGRMTAGPPRIAPLFDDLDPSKTAGAVRVLSEAGRVVVSWAAVPEYAQFGLGVPQTFQVRLYPDGHIEFSYSGVNPSSAVVGIAPGNLAGPTTLVDFRSDPGGVYSGAVAERFGNSLTLDVVTVAQQFYQTHDDAFDYLVIYNNMGIPALGEGTVAYESTVRSAGTGYGVATQDGGQLYGSASRLQSLLNLGPLSQYPVDPNALVPARAPQGDTPLTILTHEAGHLFLAFASVADASDPTGLPMLGFAGVHWSFVFNSEASVMEGERIQDRGPGVSPEFLTTDTVQGYAPLDQYLMGFRPAQDVPDTFYVSGYSSNVSSVWHPLRGVGFDGTWRNVAIGDVIQAMGRRTPDFTVAQRRFRFAFVLVVAQGSEPSAADLAQVDAYRQQFEAFYAVASSDNAAADTSLRHSMKLSLFPAGGVVAGGSTTAAIAFQTPPPQGMTIQLQAPNGYARVPAAVTVPAGAAGVSFVVSGVKTGVEELLATPGDASYETAAARVQVADASMLKLVPISSAGIITVELTDANNLRYSGARIMTSVSAGGSVTPTAALTDEQGQAAFQWTPGGASTSTLVLSVEGAPSVSATFLAGSAAPAITAVVNAASFTVGISPGGLETVFGFNLAGGQTAVGGYPWPATLGGVKVLLNGTAATLLYASDNQINFFVPEDALLGSGTVTVVTPSGVAVGTNVNVTAIAPGIFAGTATSPVRAGDTLEFYCTGLGAGGNGIAIQPVVNTTKVFIGATPVTPVLSGPATGVPGLLLYEVQVPAGLTPGPQPLMLSVDLVHSNSVTIMVQ